MRLRATVKSRSGWLGDFERETRKETATQVEPSE